MGTRLGLVLAVMVRLCCGRWGRGEEGGGTWGGRKREHERRDSVHERDGDDCIFKFNSKKNSNKEGQLAVLAATQ